MIRPFVVLLLAAVSAIAQRSTGEIRLQVKDPSGAVIQVAGSIAGQATGVDRSFESDATGLYALKGLPLGRYLLKLEKPGFAPYAGIVEVESQVPVTLVLTLSVLPVKAEVEVTEEGLLLDPLRTSATQYVSAQALRERPGSSPGRSIVDLVNMQPGWLLEANGVLHPRGSEYDVQYVVDGIPLYDNRSPAFAQSLGIEEFQSLSVRTAGYPAEFGLRLGGVVEVAAERDSRQGTHGSIIGETSSFSTGMLFSSLRHTSGKMTVGMSGEAMKTGRYLDPPVEENYTNRASGGGFSAVLERNWSASDRTRLYFERHRTGFLVPNELLQQAAGQRQDRSADENLGQFSHTHIFSNRVLGQFRSSVRNTNAKLWSNAMSTPIAPQQDRGFWEVYAGGHVSAHYRNHEVKTGVETSFTSVRENLGFSIVSYRLGTVRVFDRDVPATFQFNDRRRGQTESAFVSDMLRAKGLTASVGLRFDRYQLIQDEKSWSPRLSVAYDLPRAGIVLRGSYDRVFQIPAVENILLASSDVVSRLGGEGAFLPLRPSRGNYFETGFSKSVAGRVRLDGGWYRRHFDNFADDSLLLNTGVSFPIAFSEADIRGFEVKVDVPGAGLISGYASYSNMVGVGRLPVAGGLFLGDDAGQLTDGDDSFAITQDQRNTLRFNVRLQLHPRLWVASTVDYNSGLPFEIEGITDPDFIAQQYGPRLLSRVNFERGRVRPSSTISAAAGLQLLQIDRTRLSLQAEAFNLANRLNLINFSGVFSGTALAAPRHYSLRLRVEF